MDQRKKIAAAIAAVEAYRSETSAQTKKEGITAPFQFFVQPNAWGLASRQDLMNQRRFWQMRSRI